MTNFYEIEFTVIKEIEISDEELREHDYEGEITDEMRDEYVGNLLTELASEYLIEGSIENIDFHKCSYTQQEVEYLKDRIGGKNNA